MSDHENQPQPAPESDKDRQERERAAMTPQSDHTPRQEEQHARDNPRPLARQAAPVDEKAAAADREARGAASIGAQVILDYNSDAAIGARGGIAGTVEENTLARDADLVALGLDPVSPVGPPPVGGPQQRAEPPPPPPAPPASAKATRMSSLAAGIVTGGNGAPAPTPQKP